VNACLPIYVEKKADDLGLMATKLVREFHAQSLFAAAMVVEEFINYRLDQEFEKAKTKRAITSTQAPTRTPTQANSAKRVRYW